MYRHGFLGMFMLAVSQASFASCGAECQEVRQMFQECINSGGRAASNYNDWVAQNGCICPGSSTGSGQRTCSNASASSSSGTTGNLVDDSANAIAKGIVYGDQQTLGAGLMGMGTAILLQGLQGDPAAEAARQQRIQQQQEEERRQAEELARQQEEKKQRLLGNMMGVDSSSGSNMQLMDSSNNTASASDGLKLMPIDAPKPQALAKKSNFYTKGYEHGSHCISHNAGTACSGVSADENAACIADYNAGYELGEKEQKMRLDEAYRKGLGAGMSKLAANGAADPDASGDCRIEWIESYNRGYYKGAHP